MCALSTIWQIARYEWDRMLHVWMKFKVDISTRHTSCLRATYSWIIILSSLKCLYLICISNWMCFHFQWNHRYSHGNGIEWNWCYLQNVDTRRSCSTRGKKSLIILFYFVTFKKVIVCVLNKDSYFFKKKSFEIPYLVYLVWR